MFSTFRLAFVIFRLSLAVAFTGTLIAAGQQNVETGLPLGFGDLAEARVTQQVTSGVTYTRIVRGATSPSDYFTVFIFRPTLEQAGELAMQLRAQGYHPVIEEIAKRAFDDPEPGPLGWRVTIGRFSSMEEANAQSSELVARGYTLVRVVYTGEDGGETSGPWVVHVLEIDPHKFGGKVNPALGTGIVPGNETLSGIATRVGALAAMNGGYFVIGDSDGTPGDLAGISVLNGRLVSEAVNGRTSLVLSGTDMHGTFIASLSTAITASTATGLDRPIDGLNRKPGLIRGCGGTGDTPTDKPKHDFTCTDSDELILFTPIFGTQTEPGEGTEVALGPHGTVLEIRPQRGGSIPPAGAVLAGTGEAAVWLETYALPGTHLDISAQIFADGTPLALGAEAGVVNGGPRLLKSGAPYITAVAEGFHYPEDPEFYYRFGGRRNPRTLAGVTAEGHLLLVAVDGRQPGYSVGASFEESAHIMRALGAVDALNLDGGGSTSLAIGTELVNRPSDATGPRPIADAIVITQ